MKRILQTSNVMPLIRMKFVVTSSKNMNGVEKPVKCLVKMAKGERVVVPRHWRNMYTSFYRICNDGQVVPVPNPQSEITQFFKLREAEATFMNALSLLTRLVASFLPFYEKDFYRCLQFFNNIGMLLWYKDDKLLQDIVFHNVSFLISVLQHLFQQNIRTELKYDPDNLEIPGQRETDFNADVETFVETGLLTDNLLQNIWNPMKLNAATREALKHLLINLELCYIDNSLKVDRVSSSLRFPWFVRRDDEKGVIERKWPGVIPALNVQFSLIYRFFNRIPPAIYERFCVRIQKHFPAQGHLRHDFRNTVYIEQDDVEVLIQKDVQLSAYADTKPSVPKDTKPSVQKDTKPSVQKDTQQEDAQHEDTNSSVERDVQPSVQENTQKPVQKNVQPSIQEDEQPSVHIHVRCPAEHVLKVQPLMSVLYQDFEELCAELPPGLVLDGYLPCPHCLLKNSKVPIRRPTKMMTLKPSIETVVCADGDRIPAALVYPTLLGSNLV